MRTLIIGLFVVMLLAMSPAGESGSVSVPIAAAQLSSEEQEEKRKADCELSQWADEQDEEFYEEDAMKDEWADTYLAAEKAVAVYWRIPRVRFDCDTRVYDGRLRVVATYETITYICDPYYGRAESGGCVPVDRDYDCDELRAWGIVNIPVIRPWTPESGGLVGALGDFIELLPWTEKKAPVVEDWMLLDDDNDGIACEFPPDTE